MSNHQKKQAKRKAKQKAKRGERGGEVSPGALSRVSRLMWVWNAAEKVGLTEFQRDVLGDVAALMSDDTWELEVSRDELVRLVSAKEKAAPEEVEEALAAIEASGLLERFGGNGVQG